MVPKFREWDDSRDEYFEVRSLSFPLNSNDKLGIVATAGDQTAYGPNMILEQSTDLKDANGKEIYEGDIVKMHIAALSPDDKIGYVEHHKQYGYSLIMGKRRYRQEYWATDNQAEYEVIGNVHENLELLEEE